MGTKSSESLSFGLRASASYGKIFGITGSGFYQTMIQSGTDGATRYSDTGGITPGQTLTVFNGGTSTSVIGNSTAFITGAFGGDGRYLTNINASSIEAAGSDQMVQYNASDRFAGVTDFRYMSASANTLKGTVNAKALVMGDTATTDISASGFGLFDGGLRLGEDTSIGTSATTAMITLNGDSSIVSVPVEAQFGTSLSVTGGATVGGVFTANGNVNLGNSATADTVQITANLTASSGAKFNKGVTIDTEGLTVSAGASTVQNLSTQALTSTTISGSSTLQAGGAATIGSGLTVNGAESTFNDNVSIASGGNLTVDDSGTFGNGVIVTDGGATITAGGS